MESGARLAPQRAGTGKLNPAPDLATRKVTAPEWAQLRSAFDALAELAPAQREAKLARLGLDPFLTGRLRAMLHAEATSGTGILDAAPAAPAQSADIAYSSLSAGTVIGGFRIERLIGRGGMGEVYLAQRDAADFTQRVALKMIRPEAVGRFDTFNAERRMLAGLEHPGIARLIDGGIAQDGRPFMALEYVEGQEINRWCADRRVTLATRLELFLALCDAVGYAHARLIVHRDIKPANILVDGDGRARLLDFGIARLLDPEESGRTTTQALATPQYAAPEQLDGSPITVATDVYALGAVLFELLTGRGPWQSGESTALPTVLRRMLHDDPPLPSKVDQDGAVSPRRMTGDLDAIVAKAMRRTPEDRYSSVEAMAHDVRRHLAHRPVRARDGARAYRLRRYLRRNRLPVAATAAIAAALLVGTATTVWQARQASAERDVAQAEAGRAEAVNQAMMLMFREASDTAQVESITARDLIDTSAKRLAQSLSPDAPQSAAVVVALSDLYQIVENTVGAQSLLEAAMARGIGRSDAVGWGRLKLKLGTILGAQRKFEPARQMLREAETIWDSDPARFRRERVETVGAEAYMLRLEGKRDEGIALLLANMPEAERAYAQDSRDLVTRHTNLVSHLVEANRLAEAANLIARARMMLKRSGRERSPADLTLQRLAAAIAARRGDTARAVVLLRDTVAGRRELYGGSVALAVDLLHYARVLLQADRPRDALAIIDEAAALSTEYFGAGTQPALMAGLTRADALVALGNVDAADRAFAEVSDGLLEEGPTSLLYAARLLTQARLSLARGNVVASSKELDAAERIFQTLGPAAAPFSRAAAALRKQLAMRSATP